MGLSGKELLRKLQAKEFDSSEERDDLLTQLAAVESLRARDVAWMMYRPDRAFRDAGARILASRHDPETFAAVLAESRGKAEAAMRSASSALFAISLRDLPQQIEAALDDPKPEVQESARRMIVEAPATPAFEPLLWKLLAKLPPELRPPLLAKLGQGTFDAAALGRWTKLVRDPDRPTKERALEVLAARAPQQSVDLLVAELPQAGYALQQSLVAALGKLAAQSGVTFADRLLPLVASGEAATRTAVLKILLGMADRREVVKRYLAFAKTLAGWARDRALASMRDFGAEVVDPAIELLSDPDEAVRAAALVVAGSFEDRRLVPAAAKLLADPDWWIRISAADILGRLRDPAAIPALVEALKDPEVRWSAVEALGHIGDARALPALVPLLGDALPEVRIEVLQVLRGFQDPRIPAALQKIATQDPMRAVRSRALEILEEIAAREKGEVPGEVRSAALEAKTGQGQPRLHALLSAVRNQGASDLHVAVSQTPVVRLHGELVRAKGTPFTAAQTAALLEDILEPEQKKRLAAEQQLDFCLFVPNSGRYRGNIYVDQKGLNGVFRVIPEKPPTIADIGLPPQLAEIADYHQGLVLVCGPSGSGKSTTLAALVNLFNETRHDHVITLEDPVEFVHPFKNCLVNQREVGRDTGSFARALRAALREDPDVIVIGEMRDAETMALAITAAETGHIVLGTMNSTTAAKSIERVITSFPADEQAQIRTVFSESLRYIVAQRLMPAKGGRRLVAAFEVLKSSQSIANLIRDDRSLQIYSAMQIGRSQGMILFDDALRDLLRRGEITAEMAYERAEKKEDFEGLVPKEFLEAGYR